MVDRANGFAHLAVRDQHAKAVRFQLRVDERLRVARLIGNDRRLNGIFYFSGHGSPHRTTSGFCTVELSSFPSFHPNKFLAVSTAKEDE